MAVVVIRDPLSGKTFKGLSGYRMYLYGESGKISFSVPFAPNDIEYGGLAQDWVTTDRSGNTPLLLRKGDNLETLKFTVTLADPRDPFFDQTGNFNAVKAVAKTRERLLVRFGPTEAGLWRITDCTVTSIRRHPSTNVIIQATVSITLTQASDAAPAVGPVKPPPKPAPPRKKPAPRIYTVVKGDCLWKIAQKFYGHGADWPRIYDANRSQIKNPHWIYPGQRFVIP